MPAFDLGETIPADTPHAVSVSLPTWESNVGYEEGESWVVSKLKTGYPRFFVHKTIQAFADQIVARHAPPGCQAMLFPSPRVARRCLDFIKQRATPEVAARLTVIDLALNPSASISPMLSQLAPAISAVVYPHDAQPLAKQYWQHTGDGVSSRRAEFCHGLYKDQLLVPQSTQTQNCSSVSSRPLKGPRRYTRPGSIDGITPVPKVRDTLTNGSTDTLESSRFLEERFGRNLDLSLVERAKSAIRRRIAGAVVADIDMADGPIPDMTENTRGLHSLREEDVYLFPCGMNAIFNAHQALLGARPPQQSINFGFPYVDTLKILQKFGPGCIFYGDGSSQDLDDLEKRLRGGERFMSLFCEFPGNPLLKCPDLHRIRRLADEYDFAVVVDETIGTFANINVLPVSDIVVSSLTKIFSGDSNVMGGSAILNPESRYYEALKNAMITSFEDTYWPEDVVFMERNSRDFASRVVRINSNSEAICESLQRSPLVKDVYYPKCNPSRSIYDAFRLPEGGYGGLLSIVFHEQGHAQAFYDGMEIAKGPSLGTNFTLCSPYVLLAHYQELPWAKQFGVDPYLVRVSVGLEDTPELQATFEKALATAAGMLAR